MTSTPVATGLNWTDIVDTAFLMVHLFPWNSLRPLDSKTIIILPDITSRYRPMEYGVGVSSAEASGEEGVAVFIKSQWCLKMSAKVTVAHESGGEVKSAVVLLAAKGTDMSDGYLIYEARIPNPSSMGYTDWAPSRLELMLDIEEIAYATLATLNSAMGCMDAPPSSYGIVLVLSNHHAAPPDPDKQLASRLASPPGWPLESNLWNSIPVWLILHCKLLCFAELREVNIDVLENGGSSKTTNGEVGELGVGPLHFQSPSIQFIGSSTEIGSDRTFLTSAWRTDTLSGKNEDLHYRVLVYRVLVYIEVSLVGG
ncbi:hypothetical protein DFP72DRAFT_841676 [Ephemerocybe angulata]|uniref:Uncharacterized protein n=1 Tax=Ephemerocybe angulata TaxID=980116 RepID=A0A8H6IBM1_9AGAR|nr:hypothetical protein DFP72DRAFT_841676 [Tulosesus angulatus]